MDQGDIAPSAAAARSIDSVIEFVFDDDTINTIGCRAAQALLRDHLIDLYARGYIDGKLSGFGVGMRTATVIRAYRAGKSQ